MSGAALVVVSVGPVQEFIAAARRTRDFWMGSTLLGEFSRTVARKVAERLGRRALIFPAPDTDEELRPVRFDEKNSQLEADDVSNVVLFEAPETIDVAAFVSELREAANDRWKEIAEGAAAKCSSELLGGWRAQLAPSPVELYAAWAPLSLGYGAARRQAMRLLAGRKACRDFEPWRGNGLPKSSLDAGRETVLERIPDTSNPRRRRGLHAKPNEQLDLVGVVKRADWGKDAVRYPSVSRVAIDPWIRGLHVAAAGDENIARLFRAIVDECESLHLRARREKNPWNMEDDGAKFPWLKTFPYEGTVLYASRHTDLLDELIEQAPAGDHETIDEVRGAAWQKLGQLRGLLDKVKERHIHREPWQYLAVLAADGDRMGSVLSAIAALPDAQNEHRRFTKAQSRFARTARDIINGASRGDQGQFSGVCVYASADDILAFVAVDQVIHCANALRKAFTREVGAVAERLGVAPPTLSVGIAIGHFMEPLEDLLDFARGAEKRAKQPNADEEARGQRPRNGLAIAIHTRGGAPLTVRDHWETLPGASGLSMPDRIHDWAKLHRRRHLPVKAAYDLRLLARDYPDGDNDEIRLEAQRILARKRIGPDAADSVAEVRKLVGDVRSAGDLHRLADELVIGQWIGDAMDQASGVPRSNRAASVEAAP